MYMYMIVLLTFGHSRISTSTSCYMTHEGRVEIVGGGVTGREACWNQGVDDFNVPFFETCVFFTWILQGAKFNEPFEPGFNNSSGGGVGLLRFTQG